MDLIMMKQNPITSGGVMHNKNRTYYQEKRTFGFIKSPFFSLYIRKLLLFQERFIISCQQMGSDLID